MSFTHQRLEVYQVAKRFLTFRSSVIKRAKRKVAAMDHLQRAGESVVLNIVHSTETWSPKERMNYLGYANGSALECAACMDILGVKGLCGEKEVGEGKGMLRGVVNMLMGMREITGSRIKENRPEYGITGAIYFGHEKLVVYQKTLAFIAGLDELLKGCESSNDLIGKIDKSATSILLNIAEGNGRFSSAEKEKFFSISHRAVVQTAALIDIVEGIEPLQTEDALHQLNVVIRLLKGLSRSINNA